MSFSDDRDSSYETLRRERGTRGRRPEDPIEVVEDRMFVALRKILEMGYDIPYA